jgi:hypothetical protein
LQTASRRWVERKHQTVDWSACPCSPHRNSVRARVCIPDPHTCSPHTYLTPHLIDNAICAVSPSLHPHSQTTQRDLPSDNETKTKYEGFQTMETVDSEPEGPYFACDDDFPDKSPRWNNPCRVPHHGTFCCLSPEDRVHAYPAQLDLNKVVYSRQSTHFDIQVDCRSLTLSIQSTLL